MSWAGRRRTIFVAIILLSSFVIAGLFLFLVFYDAPTCADGILNQDERGIDCGGSCERVCNELVSEPIVHWSRSFEVVPGVYNAVAYIENPNSKAGLRKATYTFKIFDSENILIAERSGETTLSPNGITPVFEGGIQTGRIAASRTFFEFDESQRWSIFDNLSRSVNVGEHTLQTEDNPRLTTTLSNNTVDSFSDIEVVAILYDTLGNAVASSRTVILTLDPSSEKEIVFTWPVEFPSSIARVEILPIVQPI